MVSQPIRLIWVVCLNKSESCIILGCGGVGGGVGSAQTKVGLILAVKTCTVALYVVSRLVLSQIVTGPAAAQHYRVSWVGGVFEVIFHLHFF